MKRLNRTLRRRQQLLDARRRRREGSNAAKRRHRLIQSRLERRREQEYYLLRDARTAKRRDVYRKKKYNERRMVAEITGELGIEDPKQIDGFLQLACKVIDFQSRELIFDLSKCTRMWPTGITLLCSLAEWVELTCKPHERPRLASTSALDNRVNSYLTHCGFYEFVHREKDEIAIQYSDHNIVKIQREGRPANIEVREAEFVDLLRKYSALTPEQLELFDAKVLTEVFANISEHGITNRDRGWWVMAQHHQNHGVLSLCFADNGIGIRNSLSTGPQREYVNSKLEDDPANEGEYIKMAIEETVTGSLAATVPARRRSGRYSSGARRGNGLKRIRATCRELSIPFAILSHYGHAFVDKAGAYTKVGSTEKRVFGGTLYHFVVPSN